MFQWFTQNEKVQVLFIATALCSVFKPERGFNLSDFDKMSFQDKYSSLL
jgi:hypothetical protein